MYVTNLNDSGPGSFREACEASGPRVVLFKVGGRIEVTSTIEITNPYITIDASLAPGDGICIGAPETHRNFTTMRFKTHDIIIRYIRFRRNDVDYSETNDDNLSVAEGSKNIMIDHCSFSQAADEAFSMYDYNNNGIADVENITIQSCLIGRAYGGSSKGQIASGALNNITWYKNLWVSNFQRNVLLKNDNGAGSTSDSYFEFINNVIYNSKFKTNFSDNDNSSGLRHLNYINNHYFEDGADQRRMLMVETTNPVKIYARGNVSPTRLTISNPVNWDEEWHITQADDFAGGVTTLPPAANAYPLADSSFQDTIPYSTPIISDAVNLLDATNLFSSLKNDYGASLPVRDAYDSARVSDAENLTQTHDATNQPIQAYNSGTPYTDTDNDGMEDAWETSTFGGLSRDGTQDFDSDGYTDLEEFLNQKDSACLPSSSTGCTGKNAPIATISSPASAGTYNKADTIDFSINYTSDTTVTTVNYYLNGNLLGSPVAPFTFSKSHISQGINTVYAVVTDACGNTSNSDTISFTVNPLEVTACSLISQPIIDGIEDAVWANVNYNELPVTENGQTKPDTNDLKAAFKVAWDATSLYFFIKVKDDTLVDDSPGLASFFRDDAVCLLIDGLNEDNTTYDGNDFYIGIRQAGTDISVNSTLYSGTNLTKASAVTIDGYTMEIKVDWSFIGITPTVGNDIGLDFRIDDDDDGGMARDHNLLWNDETNQLWNNPTTFGTLKLTNTTCQNTTGITDIKQNEIVVYPNPTNGELTIKTENSITKIDVYNSLGALVLSKGNISVKTTNLSLNKLPKGIYTVKVFDANSVLEQKIIKQ